MCGKGLCKVSLKKIKQLGAMLVTATMLIQMPVTAMAQESQEPFQAGTIDEKQQKDSLETEEKKEAGWQGTIEEGNRHYLDENGEKLIGLQKIEEKTFLFDEDGIVQTSWQKVELSLIHI